MAKKFTIALAGNPNVGKSTLFNTLTGTRQHVGNWPGKTIEKAEGRFKHKGYDIRIIDLPGTYSLTAYSSEEIIARDFIINNKPDVVISIIDANNIERTLYLTIQLIELGANVIVGLNMVKTGLRHGIEINEKKLSHFLGVPVVKIEANKKKSVNKLMDEVIKSKYRPRKYATITYGNELEDHISKIQETIKENTQLPERYQSKWVALKLLENDKQVINIVKNLRNGNVVIKETKKNIQHLKVIFGEDLNAAIADARYGFIRGAVKESVKEKAADRLTKSERIDKIVTNKFLGIPIFLIMMWLMFHLTFTIGAPLVELIGRFFGWLGSVLSGWLISANAPTWIASLIENGIIGGVGSVIVFLPNILLLFMMIAILEDSGYMARAVFVLDSLMHKIGLHGKSFIPLVLGFGCNVPAIMATRTLETKKDKLLTILINPLMSCSARLPIYVLFTSVFFKENQSLVIMSIYLLGVILAVLMGLLFKRLFFKGLSSPLVMELPPYRMPAIFGVFIHMWERGKEFLKKAGTIILVAVIVIWFLGNLPLGVEYASQDSLAGKLGSFFAPVFEPLGFGTWQAATALMFGIVAKEIVIGTLGTVYSGGLGEALATNFTPLSAYAFMVMSLIYIPCIATIAVIRRETNSWKWTFFAVGYSLALAWVVAFIVYQGGLLLGFG